MRAPTSLCVLLMTLQIRSDITIVQGGCDRQFGPAGPTECFLGAPYYDDFQCGTCLSNAYIIQKSAGRHICRENASYCYHQCMIETFNIAEGPVYEGCSCVEGQPLPQADSILPPDCYSPDGTDCSWYGRCLAARFPCSGHQAEYAVSYGAKFCDLHLDTTQFSDLAVTWIGAVRKCLQVELVPLLRLCRRPPTCNEIRRTAFISHQPCYFQPYGGFSVCQVPPLDWLKVFWKLKQSFVRTFVESFKTLYMAARDCGPDYSHRLGQLVYVLDIRPSTFSQEGDGDSRSARSADLLVERPADEAGPDDEDEDGKLTDDELAHAVVTSISDQLGWATDTTVDWYAFAAPSPHNGTLAIQLFMVDLVDIGLMKPSEAVGKRRLNDTMRQLSDVVSDGLVVESTSGGNHVTVTSLRRCDGDAARCRNASVLAVSPIKAKPQRPRALVTSSNYAVTSLCLTTVQLVGLCSLVTCVNRLILTDFAIV